MCMILDICGGEASTFSIVGKIKDERKIIVLDQEKFSKVIGFSITGSEIKKILTSLGCDLKISGKKIKVLSKDNFKSLSKRVLKIEHILYPKAILKVMT